MSTVARSTSITRENPKDCGDAVVQAEQQRPYRGGRIVMVVNNPGSNDYRVVKSAEATVRAGYACTVLGILKPGFLEREVINGVEYRRVALPLGIRCVLAGMVSTRWWLSWLRKPLLKRMLLADKRPRILYLVCKMIILAPFHLVADLAACLVAAALALLQVIWLRSKRFLALFDLLRPAESECKADSHLFVWTKGALANDILASAKCQLSRLLKGMVGHFGVAHDCLLGRYLLAFFPHLARMEADLYHCHELWPLQSCVLAAKVAGASVLYDSHELEAYRNTHWSKGIMRMRRQLEHRLIKNVDSVFAVSPGCARTIESLHGLDEVGVLRNIPLRDYVKSSRSVRDDLGLDASVPLLLYVGSVTFNRGLEVVLEALQRLPGYHLVTVGPVQAGMEEKLSNSAKRLGVQQRFHMLEKVPPAELVSYISSADVSVLPIQNVCLSYYHCLPNKLFESMFAGVPVAASDFPDMKEVIEEWQVGDVFDETCPDSMANVIRTVYERRDQFYSLAKLEAIQRTLCFEEESKKIIEAYVSLIGSTR